LTARIVVDAITPHVIVTVRRIGESVVKAERRQPGKRQAARSVSDRLAAVETESVRKGPSRLRKGP
jgi:hypothetical protein